MVQVLLVTDLGAAVVVPFRYRREKKLLVAVDDQKGAEDVIFFLLAKYYFENVLEGYFENPAFFLEPQ